MGGILRRPKLCHMWRVSSTIVPHNGTHHIMAGPSGRRGRVCTVRNPHHNHNRYGLAIARFSWKVTPAQNTNFHDVRVQLIRVSGTGKLAFDKYPPAQAIHFSKVPVRAARCSASMASMQEVNRSFSFLSLLWSSLICAMYRPFSVQAARKLSSSSRAS